MVAASGKEDKSSSSTSLKKLFESIRCDDGGYSDKRIAKIIHSVSVYAVKDTNELALQCDIIDMLRCPCVGARKDLNILVAFWLELLSNFAFPEYNSTEQALIKLNRRTANRIGDSIELLSKLVGFSNSNTFSIMTLITPTDTILAVKMTSSLLIGARCGHFSSRIVHIVMPTLCHLLGTLSDLIEDQDNSSSTELVEEILSNVAELIWTLMAHGKTAAPTVYTLLHILNTDLISDKDRTLDSEVAILTGAIKSLGATLWGNPPFADGLFSLRIFWLDMLTQLRELLTKLVVVYAKSAKTARNDVNVVEHVIIEIIGAVKRMVDGYLNVLAPDEWDALADIVEFGLAPLLVMSSGSSSVMSSRSHNSGHTNYEDEEISDAAPDDSGLIKQELLALLHQFQFQDARPPVHFHLIVLRLLLIGEGVLDLSAARGVLNEPVECIRQFMECVFTGKTNAQSRLDALKMITEPQFFERRPQSVSLASIASPMSMTGSVSNASQSTLTTYQWQQYYSNLPPPAIWEVCVIHKAPGFITHFLQVLTECATSRRRGCSAPSASMLQKHAIQTLGKVYRSIYTVSTDREYVLDTLVNVACGTHFSAGKASPRYIEMMNDIKATAILQIEYALVASFTSLVHTHAKVPRLVSALMQVARHWIMDANLAAKAIIPLSRIRADEYGRASILPRNLLVEETDDSSSCGFSLENVQNRSNGDDDSELLDDQDDISVENDEVVAHPFLFCKRGDPKLGIFRDDNSSRRSHSKKGTIIPMDRISSCLEDVLHSTRARNKVESSWEEEAFLQCMIYSTLEAWALAGIRLEFDFTRAVPKHLSIDAKIARSAFLSVCVHYEEEDEDGTNVLLGIEEEFISNICSGEKFVMLNGCKGLIRLISGGVGSLGLEWPIRILVSVLSQLEKEIGASDDSNTVDDKAALLYSVLLEFYSTCGTDCISSDLLCKTALLCYRTCIAHSASRESKLLSLRCISKILINVKINRANLLLEGFKDYDAGIQSKDEMKQNPQAEDGVVAVFWDLFSRRQFDESKSEYGLAGAGSATLLNTKFLSREADDIKRFDVDNGNFGAWICNDTLVTCRIGAARNRGWVEVIARSPCRCDRRLVRLSGFASSICSLIYSTPWGPRADPEQSRPFLARKGVGDTSSSDEKKKNLSIDDVEVGKSEILTRAVVAIKSFEKLANDPIFSLPREGNIETYATEVMQQYTWGHASSEKEPKPTVMELFSQEKNGKDRSDNVRASENDDTTRRPRARSISDNGGSLFWGVPVPSMPKQKKCASTTDDVVGSKTESNSISSRGKGKHEDQPLTVHQWLHKRFGSHSIHMKCVLEIKEQLNQLGYNDSMLGCSYSPSCENASYFGNEKLLKQLIPEKIQRGLAILDRTVALQPHKVALFFSSSSVVTGNAAAVPGDDQSYASSSNDERRLLSAAHGSPQFWDFALGLGTMVKTQDLTFYSSGIDTSSRAEDGEYALIWMGDDRENKAPTPSDIDAIVLFHCVTLMPHVDLNTMIRNRKRHVGNDYVHIVFSERDDAVMRRTSCSCHDGNVYTNYVSGEFGLCTIFVDTLPATPKFLRVTVSTKPDLLEDDTASALSLLRGNYILPREYVPQTVRRLAIRADILCRALMEDKTGLASNWEERLHIIHGMQRHLKL